MLRDEARGVVKVKAAWRPPQQSRAGASGVVVAYGMLCELGEARRTWGWRFCILQGTSPGFSLAWRRPSRALGGCDSDRVRSGQVKSGQHSTPASKLWLPSLCPIILEI